MVNQLQRLQGVKHHMTVDDEEEEEDDDVLRDEFSIHKMVVMVTEPGKVRLCYIVKLHSVEGIM